MCILKVLGYRDFHIQWEDHQLCFSTLQVPPAHYQLSFCCFFTFIIIIIVITSIHIFFLLSLYSNGNLITTHLRALCKEPYTKEDLLCQNILSFKVHITED